MKGSLYSPTPAPTTADSLLGVQASGPNTRKYLIADLITLFLNNIPAAEGTFGFVSSGGVWSGDAYASTRAASMTAARVKVNTTFLSIAAVTARIFTASKDTYVDVLDNLDGTGTLVYTEVANNAASPALAANSLRLAIIVTGASNIANVGTINQGQEDKVLPIASSAAYSVTDSLGNLICSRDPAHRIIGYRQLFVDATTSSASAVAVPALLCPVIVPTGRKIRVTVRTGGFYNGTGNARADLTIWDGTVGSGTLLGTTWGAQALGGGTWGAHATARLTPAAASKTFNAGIHSGSGGGTTTLSTTAAPVYLEVELL